MRVKISIKIMVFILSTLFLSVMLAGTSYAYGDKSRDNVVRSAPPPPPKVKEYTREELEDFFSGLPDGIRNIIINKTTGKPRTRSQLIKIRNIFFDAEKWKHLSDEAAWQAYEEIAIVLDEAGQHAEIAAAFLTGGTSTFVTGTLFGATRAGINAVNKGKGAADVIQDIAVAIVVDKIMAAKGLEKFGKMGGKYVDMVYRANKLAKNQNVVKYLAKMGAKAGIVKYGEKYTKEQIGAILGYVAKTVRNIEAPPPPKASQPAPTIYRNQAGIW